MTGRRGILAVVVASVLVMITGCSGLPTSGPVNAGLPPGGDPGLPDTSFIPNGPQEGATPEQIVDGFIAAGTSPAGGWEIARLFLAPDARTEWDPNAGVTVDDFSDRSVEAASDENVSVELTPLAEVDAAGSYNLAEGAPISLPFTLAQQDNGQWRITSAPNGIVLDRRDFAEVFHAYPLMYFDASWQYLVPDMRWFPARSNSAVRIVQGLLDGPPSAWLGGSVSSAFPEDVSLVGSSVPIESGVAKVDLSASALSLDPATVARMQAQLEASLAAAGAGSVEMTAAGDPLSVAAAPTHSTRVDSRALVESAGGFGFLSGDSIEPIAGLSQAMTRVSPVGVEVSSGQDIAAVRAADGHVYRVGSDDSAARIDARAGLVDPTIDPFGYIWSVPASEPTALSAFAPDGTAVAIADAWSGTGASRVTAMRLSRDGARIAALLDIGGEHALYVAGVIRDSTSYAPVSLGEPVRLATLPGSGVDVAWLDQVTLGVIAENADTPVVIVQQVGGEASQTVAPVAVTDLAGANAVDAVRLRGADGTLLSRRGSTWQSTASDIAVLAIQQGVPG